MSARRPASRIAALVATALVTALVTALALATALPATAAAGAAGTSAAAPGRWAPADRAEIRPGVQMLTAGAQCTGNFVFTDRRGRVYVGYAAHCAGRGEATDTDGCTTPSRPLGTRVRFVHGESAALTGRRVGLGRLAYSSWITMQRRRTTNPRACAANDFALVRVGRSHVRKVNPTVPLWGGPTGLAGPPAVGERVHGWGRSSLRPTSLLSPKVGASLGPAYGGWGFDAYTLTPGIPGDSGSGILDASGRAVGTLSTVAVTPYPASNGLGTLRRELGFARRHSGIAGLRLVRGSETFAG